MPGSRAAQLWSFFFLFLFFGEGVVSLTKDGKLLLDFKMNVGRGIEGSPGYNVLDSWSEGTDPCDWKQVEWNASCQVVAVLQLAGLGLSGTLPDFLGQLQSLIKLDLSNNGFEGPIASGIGDANELKWLDLSNNNLSGSIPAELGKLQNLQVLRLSGNRLNGTIPENLGNTTSLAVVDLSINKLSGNFTGGLCRGGRLTWMDLSNNSLVGGIPEDAFLCKNLQRLRLGNNFLTGSLPRSLLQLSNLEFLELGGNKFEGEIPDQLGDISQLQLLNLEANLFNGSIPQALGTLMNLKALNLANNKLSGAIPPAIFDNGQLLTLQLSHNGLTGPIPSNLSKMANLEHLLLSDNRLSGEIPNTIGGLTRLLQVELSNNTFNGSIPPEFGNLINQYSLNLSGNHLTGNIPGTLGKLTKLNYLDLSDNALSGAVPEELTQMLALIVLDLSNNHLSGQLPLFRIPDLSQSNFDGNPGLCNPGLQNVSIPPCIQVAQRAGGGGRNSRKRIGRDFGFAVTGLVFVLGCTLACLWLYRRMNPVNSWRSAVIDPAALPVIGSFFTNVYDRDRVNFEELVQNSIVKENLISVNRFTTLYRAANREGVYPDLNVKLLRVEKPIVEHYRNNCQELEKVLQREYLAHKNIMRPLGFILHEESLYILHEHVPKGVLQHRLSSKYDKMNWGVRYNIALGVAQGLSHVHDEGRTPVIHLDITSGNIFLSSSFDPVVGDAELVEVIEPSRAHKSITTVAGSIGYIAPEYAFTMQVTKKSNIYSYGVVLLELLTGRCPTDDSFGNGLDLVGWVRCAPSRGETAEQILDASVSTESFPVRQQMLAVLKVALRCTDPTPLQRPEMGTIVEMLQRAGLQPQSQVDDVVANHGR